MSSDDDSQESMDLTEPPVEEDEENILSTGYPTMEKDIHGEVCYCQRAFDYS